MVFSSSISTALLVANSGEDEQQPQQQIEAENEAGATAFFDMDSGVQTTQSSSTATNNNNTAHNNINKTPPRKPRRRLHPRSRDIAPITRVLRMTQELLLRCHSPPPGATANNNTNDEEEEVDGDETTTMLTMDLAALSWDERSALITEAAHKEMLQHRDMGLALLHCRRAANLTHQIGLRGDRLQQLEESLHDFKEQLRSALLLTPATEVDNTLARLKHLMRDAARTHSDARLQMDQRFRDYDSDDEPTSAAAASSAATAAKKRVRADDLSAAAVAAKTQQEKRPKRAYHRTSLVVVSTTAAAAAAAAAEPSKNNSTEDDDATTPIMMTMQP